MILSFRDVEDQYDSIEEGSASPCEQCELKDKCLKHKGDGLEMADLANGSELCYLNGFYCHLVECGKANVSEGIGDHYKVDDDGLLVESWLSEDNSDDDNYYEDDENDDDDEGDEEDSESTYEINEGRWEPAQPVFISAQTGSGKNYFIENTLIPYVKQLNYDFKADFKILIISNRRALKEQIKNRINRNRSENSDDNIIHCNDIVDVVTYQGVLRRKDYFKAVQKKKGKYIYIICDEAHFFTSDAMFNPYTHSILSTIVETFQNAIRVYMSATPYECLRYIVDEEEKYYNRDNEKLQENQIAFYHFNRDYSYLDITAYSEIEELYEIISDSVAKKKRWLIFIDNKKQCASVSEKLKEHIEEEKILVVDAESKRNEKFASLLKNENLDSGTYVLISTSVIDNGINLNNVDNIIVSDMNPVKCMQMVGRARKTGNPTKLYIKRFDTQDVQSKIDESEAQKEAYSSYDKAYNSGNVDSRRVEAYEFQQRYFHGIEERLKIAKKLFGVYIEEPSTPRENKIARSLLEERAKVYPLIKAKTEQDGASEGNDTNIHIGQSYLEYQLSWFGKEYCKDNDLTYMDKDKSLKELISFLEECATNGTKFEDADQKKKRTGSKNQKEDSKKYGSQAEFKATFTRLAIAIQGKRKNNHSEDYGAKLIREVISDLNLPFKLDSDKGWTVIYIDDNEKMG